MISIEAGVLLAFVINLIGAAIGYGRLQGLIADIKEKTLKLEEWKENHERDAQTMRGAYDLRLTAFEVRLGRGEEKFEQISRDMLEIKADLKTLLGRRRDDRESA